MKSKLDFKPGDIVVHRRTILTGLGKDDKETIWLEVRILAIAEGYAMVRRKGASPFVSSLKDLAKTK